MIVDEPLSSCGSAHKELASLNSRIAAVVLRLSKPAIGYWLIRASRPQIDQFKEQQSLNPKIKQPRLVLIADREGDIDELFCSNMASNPQGGLLVRALHPRRMMEDGQIVWSHLENQPELGRLELEVPQQGKRKARLATLVLRSALVKLGVPRDKAKLFKAKQTLELWAIEAREINAPEKEERLHRKLLSSTPAPASAEVQRGGQSISVSKDLNRRK